MSHVTEDQAAKMWCPHVRHQTEDSSPPGNRQGVSSSSDGGVGTADATWNKCVGSRCMAWRWAGWPTTFGTIAAAPEPEHVVGEKTNKARLGYCGLAGRPA